MAQYQRAHLESAIMGRPLCLKCGVPMWLTRIEPHDEDHDQRTFECSICRESETAVVKFK